MMTPENRRTLLRAIIQTAWEHGRYVIVDSDDGIELALRLRPFDPEPNTGEDPA